MQVLAKTCKSNCRSWPRRESLNASLGQDFLRLKSVKIAELQGDLNCVTTFHNFSSDRNSRHLVNLKKLRTVNFRLKFVSKRLKNGRKRSNKDHMTFPGPPVSLAISWYELSCAPKMCLRINAEIVARYKIFRNSKFLHKTF